MAQWTADALTVYLQRAGIALGQFMKRTAVGMLLDSDGFLWSVEEAEREAPRFKRQGITIIGPITEAEPS